MLVLEQKFKENFGENYFPYFVATLSAMMTYNHNEVLFNIISLKDNNFVSNVIKNIVPLPNINFKLDSKIENKLIYVIRTRGYSTYKISSFDNVAQFALKNKKILAFSDFELLDDEKEIIFVDKKPTLVLDLEDKEFNIDYDFHMIDSVENLKEINNKMLIEITQIFKDKLHQLNQELLLAYLLYKSLILSIKEFIFLFFRIYLAENGYFKINFDKKIDYKELFYKIFDYSYQFFTNFKAYYEEIEKHFYIPYIPKKEKKIIETAKNMLIFEEKPLIRELYRKTNTTASFTKAVLKKHGFLIDGSSFYYL